VVPIRLANSTCPGELAPWGGLEVSGIGNLELD
jgi:hypothetical protein